jgi:uncharacterized protein (DUF58 family)
MRRRPTRRAFVVVGIGGLLILAGATAQSGWLFVLSAGVLGLVLGSLLSRHRLDGIVITRTIPRRARVGDALRVGLGVTNSSGRATPLLTITDTFPAADPWMAAVDRLSAGQALEVEHVLSAGRRGRFSAGEMRIESSAPFGLIRTRRIIAVASEVVVVPNWVELRSFPLVQPSSSPSDVSHERPRPGAGDEFLGVREYRPGDPLRAVHWRSSARAGSLVVREYEQETSSRTAIVIAGGDAGAGPTSAFESLVSAAASVGVFALATGHHIEVVSLDGQIDHQTDPSHNGFLDHLASLAPADASLEPLVEAALGHLGRRGTVVICASDSGACGASIDVAINRVERAGAQPVLIVARSSGWTGAPTQIAFDGYERRIPLRVIEADKDLASCLA